jgi:hypothetical protein
MGMGMGQQRQKKKKNGRNEIHKAPSQIHTVDVMAEKITGYMNRQKHHVIKWVKTGG